MRLRIIKKKINMIFEQENNEEMTNERKNGTKSIEIL